MINNKSIILLSGGLDSLVSLGVSIKKLNIIFALSFDYGQKSAKQELDAAKKISEFYSIKHKIIELPWLREITSTSLVNAETDIPNIGISELDNPLLTKDSAKKVWVPNRNGVFLNIAASFADSMKFNYIIFGANSEEAATFPDNSEIFIEKINNSFEYSTLVQPKVVAPLAKLTKKEIVKLAIEHEIPFNLLRSCYSTSDKHCGECESCLRLKRALKEVTGNTSLVEFKI